MKIQVLSDAAAVEKALAEFDSLGGNAFRTRYGFGASTQYYISHAGRLSDAMAIAGVAHVYRHSPNGALTYDQFSGGEAAVSKSTTRKLASCALCMKILCRCRARPQLSAIT